MSLAPQELENSASKYASDAIKFDSQGARGMAIANYQKAIDSLVRLMRLYPNSKLNPIYKERTLSYQTRIKDLQGMVSKNYDFESKSSNETKSDKVENSANNLTSSTTPVYT